MGGAKAWSKGSFVSLFRFGEEKEQVDRGVEVSIPGSGASPRGNVGSAPRELREQEGYQ